MFKNYFKIALRTILKHKGYSFINIAGLSVGIACCLLILLYVTHELGYDRHHQNSNRIFRLTTEFKQGERSVQTAYVQSLPSLREEFPEIIDGVRLFTYSWKEKSLVSNETQSFFEENFFLADPAIFNVFTFSFLRGIPETALADPRSLVISEKIARKYFGADDPMGKVLSVKNLGQADFIVTGVISEMPGQSHFHCDFIAPLASGRDIYWENFLEQNSFYTYVLLAKGSSPSSLENKFPEYLRKHFGERAAGLTLKVQPLGDIHLRSHLSGEIEANGDIKSIYLFSFLAAVILLVACVNFVNLATARSINRAREVGLRKVVGARRGMLLKQFLAEAVLMAILALPFAFLLAELVLPAFNSILGRNMSLGRNGGTVFFLGALVLALLAGLLSGAYPAFILSAFQPARVLKGKSQAIAGASLTRKILVVVQYSASVVLMIGTLVVAGQMKFIQTTNLGFEKDQIVIVPLKDYESQQKYQLLKAAWLQNSRVVNITASEALPSETRGRHAAWVEGMPSGEEVEVFWNAVDFDFLETYGMSLAAGRGFSRDFSTDEKLAYMINEAAAKAFGWESPLGKKMTLSNRGLKNPVYEVGDVIGVVKDFHFVSLHERVEPVVLKIYPERLQNIAVKIRPDDVRGTLASLEAEWRKTVPGRPFDFRFFNDQVDAMYQADRRTGRVFGYSTALSLLLSCLGLFGLASYSAAQRTREVGIRKVLGASVSSLIRLLSGEFARLVVAADVIGLPVAYFLTRKWLAGFAYHIRLGPEFFLAAVVLSFAIAFLTVSIQAVKAALADPVKSLRYE